MGTKSLLVVIAPVLFLKLKLYSSEVFSILGDIWSFILKVQFHFWIKSFFNVVIEIYQQLNLVPFKWDSLDHCFKSLTRLGVQQFTEGLWYQCLNSMWVDPYLVPLSNWKNGIIWLLPYVVTSWWKGINDTRSRGK